LTFEKAKQKRNLLHHAEGGEVIVEIRLHALTLTGFSASGRDPSAPRMAMSRSALIWIHPANRTCGFLIFTGPRRGP